MSISIQEILAIFIAGGILALSLVSFLVFISFRYSKKQQWFEREIAGLKTGFEQSISKAQLDMQEETLSAIADKLHDDVKNNLNAIKLMMMSLARNSKEPETQTTLGELTTELGNVINEIRLTSHSLKTDRIANIGLAEAIEYETYLLKKQSGIQISIEKDAQRNIALDEKNTVYLFRMFQETMGNVLSHAKASNVLIKLLYPSQNKFELSIADDGVGFNVREGRNKKSGADGIGLSGLYKRAFQIGAELNIQSIVGKGTTVKIELPLL